MLNYLDASTDFPLWSERYDREMEDVFAVQDEIASKIAAALRITLTPQEQEALAAKPTENLQAYDLYLRGRNYATRVARQDLQVALQMYENAAALDPGFALAHAGIANVCAQYFTITKKKGSGLNEQRRPLRRQVRAAEAMPEIRLAEAWIDLAEGRYEAAISKARAAIQRAPDVDGGYYLLGRALFVSGRFQEIVEMMEEALIHAGENYNVSVTINNALGALGRRTPSRTSFIVRSRCLRPISERFPKMPGLACFWRPLSRNWDDLKMRNARLISRLLCGRTIRWSSTMWPVFFASRTNRRTPW